MKVFTLGYQGLNLETYNKTLLESNVGIVLDVREVPWSYNRRYIKSVLQTSLLHSGIKYTHLKSCGNPSSNRKTAKSIEECLSRYRDYLNENRECLHLLLEYIKTADSVGKPACLTCYESDFRDCHRSILLDFIGEIEPSLRICHLQHSLSFTIVNPMPLLADTTAQLL